jgi:glycosyltransferase involved in cell wall biosynthesis
MPKAEKKIMLSVVVPFYNEEDNLPELHSRLIKVLSEIDIKSQVVYINDGSRDGSISKIKKEIKKRKFEKVEIKLIQFRKNFGQTAAVLAGIENSDGELISFLDSDLQNDPRDIPRFLDEIEKGYDAVFGWRKERKDATLRSFMSRAANRLINWVFTFPYHDVGCSARIVKREFVKNLELFGELHRIMPVLIYLKGANVGEITVAHHERKTGASKYGFDRILKTFIDIITVKFLHTYGTKPAYVFGTMGLGSIFVSFLAVVAVLYRKLVLDVFVHRDPMFLIAIFFGFVGVQFVLMGLLAELQVRTYFGSQKKSIYDISEIINF